MRKDEYIQEVISRIENKKAKAEVEREISAHIDDRISYYTDAGWDEETANEKAMEHMGDAKEISQKLGMIHAPVLYTIFALVIILFTIRIIINNGVNYRAFAYLFEVSDLYEKIVDHILTGLLIYLSLFLGFFYRERWFTVSIGVVINIIINDALHIEQDYKPHMDDIVCLLLSFAILLFLV